jgi:H+-translocating NAD(P) transhydrogenase subunit alpha
MRAVSLIIGVPKETAAGERRVAMVPGVLAPLLKAGAQVLVEAGAGSAAGYPDAAYTDKGARLAATRAELLAAADVVVQVRVPGSADAPDLSGLRAGQIVIGFADPLGQPQAAAALAERGVALLALELMPRITRAQSMDALSSMATIAGYKAVLLAADALPRLFPLLMTAAGTVTPARVLVIGAGVAGLFAAATARRLGAVVTAYDVRPASREQVESVGAKFLSLALDSGGAEDRGGYAKEMDADFYRRQRELMTGAVRDHDVVISTAAVPGKRAPVLVTAEMVAGMAPGSVIVDLAAERGGNCELTRPGETVVEHDVTILGPLNLASTVPYHASQLYAKNVVTFLSHLLHEGKLPLDAGDEITRETLVTRDGQVVHQRVRPLLGLEPLAAPPPPTVPTTATPPAPHDAPAAPPQAPSATTAAPGPATPPS